VTWLSNGALERLRQVAARPDLGGTKYDLGDEIDRGGMGTVYRARDRELERDVALKVLSLPDPSERIVARALREARILAQLEHPAIVPVHDVGRLADGRVFYVMKLVRGSRLDAHVTDTGPGLGERLRIFQRICEAVAFAHARGVLHRDLKPQNVMVGPFGEVLVLDWGVAKILADPEPDAAAPGRSSGDAGRGPDAAATGDAATTHGTVLGTPGYMAPEQARGEPVDARADVHALGAILHFLLAGRAPAGGPGLEPSVPRPLRAVCLKALAADPPARYASVQDLADDVALHLAGLPVRAYRETPLDRVRRLAWRYRTPLVLILAYLVMRLVLLAVTNR
jgi:serine/threonine protein kinase